MIRYNYHVLPISARRHVVARIEAGDDNRAVINLDLLTSGEVTGLGVQPRTAEIITIPLSQSVALAICATIERDGLAKAMQAPSWGRLFTVGF